MSKQKAWLKHGAINHTQTHTQNHEKYCNISTHIWFILTIQLIDSFGRVGCDFPFPIMFSLDIIKNKHTQLSKLLINSLNFLFHIECNLIS